MADEKNEEITETTEETTEGTDFEQVIAEIGGRVDALESNLSAISEKIADLSDSLDRVVALIDSFGESAEDGEPDEDGDIPEDEDYVILDIEDLEKMNGGM